MRGVLRIDSFLYGAGCRRPIRDLRERVITAVETESVATRGSRTFRGQRGVGGKALQRWYQQRSAAPKPRGGERFAAGRVRGRDFGSDRPTAGPDLGRNGCRTAQATDQNQPQLALAGFSGPTQHHAQKVLQAAERQRADVARARRRWIREQGMAILPGWCLSTRPPSARTWWRLERAVFPRGVRVIGAVPSGRWETITCGRSASQ